jgi:hypothetical protein
MERITLLKKGASGFIGKDNMQCLPLVTFFAGSVSMPHLEPVQPSPTSQC